MIGSIKSNMGHLEAGAGISRVDQGGVVPAASPDPAEPAFRESEPEDPVRRPAACAWRNGCNPGRRRYGQPPRAGVNSFGFGGTNGHAILEAAPAPETRCAHLPKPPTAAPGCCRCRRAARRRFPTWRASYLDALGDERGLKHAPLRDICYLGEREAIPSRAPPGARRARQGASWRSNSRRFRGRGSANSSTGRHAGEPARPVFVCSGMGQQWWAMGRELLAQEPVYRRAVEEVSELFGPLAGWSLLDELMADERASRGPAN